MRCGVKLSKYFRVRLMFLAFAGSMFLLIAFAVVENATTFNASSLPRFITESLIELTASSNFFRPAACMLAEMSRQ